MKLKTKLWLLAGISLLLIFAFLFIDLGGAWTYILEKRSLKVVAIIITGLSIAIATVLFQTITQNKILTPNIMGLDALYLFIYTVVVFLFGSTTVTMFDRNLQFIIVVLIMLLFSGLLYRFLFTGTLKNVYFLLLIGFIAGTFFDSLATFMQVLIDPNEFQVVQDKMFASFNNINTDILLLAVILVVLVLLYMYRYARYFDVLALGRDMAVNLGVPFESVVKRLLMMIAILISVATALVGPITFLGLIVANLSYEFMKTYKHVYLITGAVFFSFIALIGGQLLVERVFTFSTTISVIINFFGGIYFIYLLLRGNR